MHPFVLPNFPFGKSWYPTNCYHTKMVGDQMEYVPRPSDHSLV